MSFLAPWFLTLGAAAVVPLLIHLLRRRIGVRVEFPAARYLARAEREHSRTLRMRNLILMVLRMLAVLIVAFAAARPAARMAGAGHAPTALAIVLDNSLSTSVVEDGALLLQRFKDLAREALGAATPDDRVWLVTADGSVRGGSPAVIRDELDRVQALSGAGSLRDAVTRAVATVEGSGFAARQVAVLTDGQRSAWSRPAQLRGDVPVLIWAPSRNPVANRAVVLAEPRPVRWTPRGILAARTLSLDSTTYRMALGDRTLARGTIGPSEEAIVRAAPAERGWTGGVIEIEPDELVADNVRHFALWIGPPPAVRVTPGAGQFVRSAVEVLRSTDRVVDGPAIAIASADEVSTVPALVFPPLDPVRLGAANRTLERLNIPWRFGPVRREAAIVRGEGMSGVSATWRYELLPRGVPDADTLASVGGSPWIVGGPGYVLVGSPPSPDATTLPVAASFLPWLGDMIAARLNAEPGSVRYATPGARVPRPTGVDAIESENGARIAIAGATFEAPAAAGAYFFVRGARRVGAVVVNAEPAESRLERWGANEIAQRVSTPAARLASSSDDWVSDSFRGVGRRVLVIPLLVLLLVVLGAETFAAATGRQNEP